MKISVLAVIIGVFALASAAVEPSAMDKATNRHILSEYGPCTTAAEAKATLEKAFKALVEEGGGVLVIPDDAPKDFRPQNSSQEKYLQMYSTLLPLFHFLDAYGDIPRVCSPLPLPIPPLYQKD